MALDIIGLTLIVVFFIRGYMKGIIVAAFSVLAILLGVICSLKLSHLLSAWLLEKHIVTSGWVQLVSYLILFVAVVLLVRLAAKAIEKSFEAMLLGWVNKSIGGFLYAFLALVVWSSVLWMMNQLHLISPETIAASKTYEYMEPVAPWVFDKVGAVWPMVKDIFTDLHEYFDNADNHLPEHVGTDR